MQYDTSVIKIKKRYYFCGCYCIVVLKQTLNLHKGLAWGSEHLVDLCSLIQKRYLYTIICGSMSLFVLQYNCTDMLCSILYLAGLRSGSGKVELPEPDPYSKYGSGSIDMSYNCPLRTTLSCQPFKVVLSDTKIKEALKKFCLKIGHLNLKIRIKIFLIYRTVLYLLYNVIVLVSSF